MQDQIAMLNTMLETYRTLLTEANERVAVNRAEGLAMDAQAKALQAELDALKAEKKPARAKRKQPVTE